MTPRRRDAGFSLAALIFFATAALILLSTAIPAYRMQAQREREEELIFRGEEYVRAIQKYQRRFGGYPQTMEALQQQNGLRFIRRLYVDPTSEKAFRPIYLNPDGSLTGSNVYSQNVANLPQLGGVAAAAINSTPLGGQTSAPPRGQTAPPPRGQAPTTPGGQTTAPRGLAPLSPFSTGGQTQTVGTLGIIGVGSDTDETSIKVYNGKQKYKEWEFIAILGAPGTTPGGVGQPQPGGVGQPQPGGVGQPQPGGVGQPQPGGFGQPQPGGLGQPRPGGFGQPQPGGLGQPQPGGFGQPGRR